MAYYFALGIEANGVAASDKRDLFPGALELMILRTLEYRPLHGYAMVQHIRRISDDELKIEEGSLYPALQRMLRSGLVTAEWGLSSTNRRVRLYRLTRKGRSYLGREMSAFERMMKAVGRVLAPAAK
jgi:transcriptional regulator